jgi:outer membrane murein-binding lipoprotein Lpp
MKKIIAILFVMVMLVMLVFGCVSRQNYDALMSEYDGLRARVESAESNLAVAQSETQTLQSDLATEQSKFTKLESDLSNEQSKSAKLENDFAAEQSKSEKLESDLTDEQNKTKKLESDFSAAQSEAKRLEGDYDTLKNKIDRAEPYAKILEVYYFVPAFEYSAADIAVISVLIDQTGDAELNEKWTTYVDRPTDERAYEFWVAVWDGLWEALYPGGAES